MTVYVVEHRNHLSVVKEAVEADTFDQAVQMASYTACKLGPYSWVGYRDDQCIEEHGNAVLFNAANAAGNCVRCPYPVIWEGVFD